MADPEFPTLVAARNGGGWVLLPPANEVCEGYVFTGVCLSTGGGVCGCSGCMGACVVAGGACVVAPGGCVWLLWGGHAWLLRGACMVALGGLRGCSGGACVVALGGHVWLLPSWVNFSGMCGCSGGACVVAPGGMRGCSRGGVRGCSGGVCMVAPGGRAWLLWGGMNGCSWGGVRGCLGGVCGFFDEIQSMSRWYTSYWNAFLFSDVFTVRNVVVFTPVCQSFCSQEGRGVSGRHPAQTPPPPNPDGHCSGRYVSYWNAFLFTIIYEELGRIRVVFTSIRRKYSIVNRHG